MRIFIFSALALFSQICLAQGDVAIPSWFDYLMSKLPGDSIAWVLAAFGLLNAVSQALGKIAEALDAYAASTATDSDDKVAKAFDQAVAFMQKFVSFAQRFINFFTAKETVKK